MILGLNELWGLMVGLYSSHWVHLRWLVILLLIKRPAQEWEFEKPGHRLPREFRKLSDRWVQGGERRHSTGMASDVLGYALRSLSIVGSRAEEPMGWYGANSYRRRYIHLKEYCTCVFRGLIRGQVVSRPSSSPVRVFTEASLSYVSWSDTHTKVRIALKLRAAWPSRIHRQYDSVAVLRPFEPTSVNKVDSHQWLTKYGWDYPYLAKALHSLVSSASVTKAERKRRHILWVSLGLQESIFGGLNW